MEPAAITAVTGAVAAFIAAAGGVFYGRRGSKADLAEIEHRIAAGLLTSVEERLEKAEQRIAKLQAELHALGQESSATRTELAVVTAERDQLSVRVIDLLDRLSILQLPPSTERNAP